MNKTLPFLVANVIEILDVDPEDLGAGEVDGANVDLDSQRKGQCAVIKTSTRQTYFLPGTNLNAYKWLDSFACPDQETGKKLTA